MINKKHRKYLKSKKTPNKDKIQSCIYMTELREIFHSWTLEEAENKLNKVIQILENLPNF
jgi:hypothetical protein